MSSPLEKPEGLSWDAASVELPPVPMLPPGPDAMSMTISAVLPTLTTPLTASVAALSAKENMFSGKLGAAQSAYQNADDSGQQSVGQLTSMLGQLGQMAQQAGGPAQALGGQIRHVRLDDAAGHAGRQGRWWFAGRDAHRVRARSGGARRAAALRRQALRQARARRCCPRCRRSRAAARSTRPRRPSARRPRRAA